MKIVTTTSVFPHCYDSAEALRRLAAVGYDTLDMAFDYCVQKADFPFMTDKYEDWAYSLRNEAERLGVSYTHSHASFNAEERGEIVDRTLRCASILGVRNIVVHPICGYPDGERYKVNGIIRYNEELYPPLIEKAEKYGIIILTENLFSNSATEMAELVSAVNSPYFGWCYDVGHASVAGYPPEDLLKVKVPPLSLHIQDNHGPDSGDEHLMPGDGTIDWGQFLRYLKEIGYKGELVLEAHKQARDAADENERATVLAELYSRAEKMRDYFLSL